MSIQLSCCENTPAFEIEYVIGTTYSVCQNCSELKHFVRSIKSKKRLIQTFDGKNQSQTNTTEVRLIKQWRRST